MADDNDETQADGTQADGTQADGTQAGGQPVVESETLDEAANRRRLLLFGIAALLLILLLGGLIAVLAGGDDDDSDVASDVTSTSSSSTSTSSLTTTPPTVPAGGGGGGTTSTTANNKPVITSFTASPTSATCQAQTTVNVTVKWTTTNATSTTLSVDGGGIYGNYGPNASQPLTPACDNAQHTYTVTAKGPNGQATKTITFSINVIPM